VDYIDHKGQLVLENGRKLDREFAHLDYGYTLTSHAAQSKTVDCVFVAQTATLSSHASDLNQFYVAISRGRSELKIYTDNIGLLQENVSETRERPMAAEILHVELDGSDDNNIKEITRQKKEHRTATELGQADSVESVPKATEEMEKIVREKRTSQQDLKREKEKTMAMGM
jgi:ATP-dependent exoDNAse (exonuclease V) alpha subunit